MEGFKQTKNAEEMPSKARRSNLTEKETQIAEMLKAGVDELVIHGDKMKNKEGKEFLALKPDLDSRAAIYLLELAGVNYNKLTFVKKGEWIPGSINIDTGERPGLDFEEDGSVFFDHHGVERAERGKATSAAKMIYDVLTKQGLLKKEEWLDVLVDFVTDIDNADYPLEQDYFMNDWWRSLYGLQKAISFESLVNIIKSGRDPREPFSRAETESATVEMANKKRAPLHDVCMNQQRLVKSSVDGVLKSRKDMEANGVKTFEPKLFGSVLVNILKAPELNNGNEKKKEKNPIPLGFTAARGVGFDSYFLWDEKNGGFFITSKFHLKKIFDIVSPLYPEAKIIRGTMIMNQGEEKVPASGKKFSPDALLESLHLKS